MEPSWVFPVTLGVDHHQWFAAECGTHIQLWVSSRLRDLDLWELMSLEIFFEGVRIFFAGVTISRNTENAPKDIVPDIRFQPPGLTNFSCLRANCPGIKRQISAGEEDPKAGEHQTFAAVLRNNPIPTSRTWCMFAWEIWVLESITSSQKPWLLGCRQPSLGQWFWLVFCPAPKKRTELSLGGFCSKSQMSIPWWKVCSSRNAVSTGELNRPESSLIQHSAEEFSQERCDLWHLHRPCHEVWKIPLKNSI